MPHADDELIGCFQLLKTIKGGVVVNMDMPGGDDDLLHQIRYKEFVNHMNSLNIKYLNIDIDKESALKKILLEYKPLYIFVPSCVDWHNEHHEVIRILRSAICKSIDETWMPNIAMYQVSIPIYFERVNLAVPMNRKQLNAKWNSFEEYYVSQKHLPLLRFAANERINGKLVNEYAAECFWVLTADKWMHLIEKFSDQNRYKSLSHCINNLNEIHKQVAKIYKSFT